MHVYKVIIIGGGVSGLSTARYLHANGFHDFLILEAQDRLGGRIRTVHFGEHNNNNNKKALVEVGAQWLHGEETAFYDLAKSSGFLHEKTSWEGKGDFLTKTGEKIETRRVEKIVNWVEEQLENIGEIEGLNQVHHNNLENKSITDQIKNSPTFSPHHHHQPESLPVGDSVGSYLRKNFNKLLHTTSQQQTTEKIGDKMKKSLDDEVRLKHAIFQWTQNFQRIDNSCNQMTDLSLRYWDDFEYTPGEQYNNFRSGGQKMIDSTSTEFLTAGNLKLNSPVQQINWQTEEIQVVTQDKKLFLCHSVIVTCSIGVLKGEKSKLFQPNLPTNLSSAIDWTGFGPVTKLYLEWDKPWWPQDNFYGYQFLWPDEFINCCDDDSKKDDQKTSNFKDTWFKSITGFDPVLDNPNVLLAWLGGPESVYLESLDEHQVGNKCAEILSNFTQLKVPQPKAVLVSKWNSNPYFRGAYSFRSIKGDQMPGDICAVLKLPIFHQDDQGLLKPALIFAGEALHKTHYSTLHGAFASGQEQGQLFLELYKCWQQARNDLQVWEEHTIDIPSSINKIM